MATRKKKPGRADASRKKPAGKKSAGSKAVTRPARKKTARKTVVKKLVEKKSTRQTAKKKVKTAPATKKALTRKASTKKAASSKKPTKSKTASSKTKTPATKTKAPVAKKVTTKKISTKRANTEKAFAEPIRAASRAEQSMAPAARELKKCQLVESATSLGAAVARLAEPVAPFAGEGVRPGDAAAFNGMFASDSADDASSMERHNQIHDEHGAEVEDGDLAEFMSQGPLPVIDRNRADEGMGSLESLQIDWTEDEFDRSGGQLEESRPGLHVRIWQKFVRVWSGGFTTNNRE